MRILVTYNARYETCEGSFFASALEQIGHEVIVANAAAVSAVRAERSLCVQGWPGDVSIDVLQDVCGPLDLFLYFEGSDLVPRGLERSPMETVCLLSDTHRNPEAHRTLGLLFDHVVVYHRNHAQAFVGRAPGSVHWVPYACDTNTFRDLGLTRDIDVGFVGRLYTRERRRVIPEIARRYRMNEQRYYRPDEIPEVYSRSKIVVDFPPGDYIPFRVFEAMSCGALLLTRRQNSGQGDMFTEGEHYETFENDDELFAKLDFYLTHESERARIAASGHREIRERHSLTQRVTVMLETVQAAVRFAAPLRSMSQSEVRRVYGSVYERCGSIDVLLKIAAEHRGDTLARAQLLCYAVKSFCRRTILGW